MTLSCARRASWIAFGLAFALSARAYADALVVTSTADTGANTLRERVAAANPGDTIFFDASLAGKTITLASQITIAKVLTIDGGANRITISGGKTTRVFFTDSQTVVLNKLTIKDGHDAFPVGGGCIRNHGVLLMNDCAVSGGYAEAGGGGISSAGTLAMERCTVSENVAFDSAGGGIDNFGGGQLVMTNCTVSGNLADGDGAGVNTYGQGSVSVLRYCTVAYNAGGGTGGGVVARTDLGFTATTSIEATILAHNTSLVGPDCGGTILSNDENVITTSQDCTLTGSTVGNSVGFDPRLGSLQMNGGFTRTHALQKFSVAIDWLHTPCGVATDQRGLPRPQDGEPNNTSVCDAGAYEAARPIVVTTLADPGGNGECTLRMAIAAANTNTAQGGFGGCAAGFLGGSLPDRITFNVSGTITLTAGALAPTDSVMIEGPGASLLTVNGNHASTVFDLGDGSGPNAYVFSGVTVSDGLHSSDIQCLGVDDGLAVDRCTIQDSGGQSDEGLPTLWFSGGRGLEIARSTLGGAQGALMVENASARMWGSTISRAPTYGIELLANGPGKKADLSLEGCTIVGPGARGVILASLNGATAGSAVVTLRSTIVSGFSLANFYNIFDLGSFTGILTSLGYNISSDATGGLTATGDLQSTDPQLGVLAYNGGQTPTFNLKPASPAIGRVAGSVPRTTVDQRGFSRGRSYDTSDSGAIERVVGSDVNLDGSVNVSDVLYLINFLFAGGPVPMGESDVNGDGAINVSDILYLINRLFAGGPAPI